MGVPEHEIAEKPEKGQGPTCSVRKAHLTGLPDVEDSSRRGMESRVR